MMLRISCHLDGMVVFSKYIRYSNGIIKIPYPMICTGISPSSTIFVIGILTNVISVQHYKTIGHVSANAHTSTQAST